MSFKTQTNTHISSTRTLCTYFTTDTASITTPVYTKQAERYTKPGLFCYQHVSWKLTFRKFRPAAFKTTYGSSTTNPNLIQHCPQRNFLLTPTIVNHTAVALYLLTCCVRPINLGRGTFIPFNALSPRQPLAGFFSRG